MFNILVVEDDKNILKLMKIVISTAGYNVFTATNGIEALEITDSKHIDLIVLDIMMPQMDGYTFTEQLRDCGNTTPIIMVTAKQLPEERCKGFIVGTDDYMVKPVNEDELLLRIKALLRRSQIANERRITVGRYTLEYDALTVHGEKGNSQVMPQKEFYLLYKLLSSPNRVFTRLQLMDEIWGMESETTDMTVNVHINRIRKRFAENRYFDIVAVRGVGYKAVIYSE